MYSSIKNIFQYFYPYQALPISEDELKSRATLLKTSQDTSCEPEEITANSLRIQRPYYVLSKVCITLNLLLFALTNILLVIVLSRGGISTSIREETVNTDAFYSPILERIELPLKTVKINGTFLNTDPISIYRMDPSPEVDAAWNRLIDIEPIPLSSAEVEKMGLDPSKTARFPEEFGFGPDAHIGRIDVFHQIHCLNTIRQAANFDYYFGKAWPDHNPPEGHKVHVSHCLYILLQNLMCTANVDVFMHYWMDTLETQPPSPDFSMNHQCRDFEAILKYQKEHSVDGAYYAENIAAMKPLDAPIREAGTLYR